MSNAVFVLDADKKPLTPCTPGMARSLLTAQKAAVFRMYPFTIILKKSVDATPQPLHLKIAPGSKMSGLALLDETRVVWGASLQHRGQVIRDAMETRRHVRRGRRQRNTRYRQPRFDNRTRPRGWLPPSLLHRVLTVETWVRRLRALAPISLLSMQLLRFDLQKLQDPDIQGAEYQQGELFGYELRAYVLEKFQHACVVCGARNVPIRLHHVVLPSRGGTNRVSNLLTACRPCIHKRGVLDLDVFLAKQPEVLRRVHAQVKAPLKDATAINVTRWALYTRLKATGLSVLTGSGAQTSFHRHRLELPKAPWVDAACVGHVETLEMQVTHALAIRATGHGGRQMCVTDKYGFPKYHKPRQKVRFGYQTGDTIKATVTKGKNKGTYIGRAVGRPTPSLEVFTNDGVHIRGVSVKNCTRLHRKDGYAYGFATFETAR